MSYSFSSPMGDLDILDSLDTANRMFVALPANPPTLEEALIEADIQNVDTVLKNSREFAGIAQADPEIRRLGITYDEAGAISCYTLPAQKGTKPPYKIINEALAGSRNRSTLFPARKLIFLFLSGLRKLLRYKAPPEGLHRGIKTRVPTTKAEAKGHQFYEKGKTVTWWGFTSTTTNLDATNGFINDAVAASTLFNIRGKDLWGYDIQSFSPFQNEAEVLLEPEAKVKVNGISGNCSFLVVNVELQPFTRLVLEDIIPPVRHSFQIPQQPSGSLEGSLENDIKHQQQYNKTTAVAAGWRVAYDPQKEKITYENMNPIGSDGNTQSKGQGLNVCKEPDRIEEVVKLLKKSDSAEVCVKVIRLLTDLTANNGKNNRKKYKHK